MVPPRSMIFTGSGDFVKQGKKLVQLFESFAGLQPSDNFLDVGSGIGRLAIPLTNYLSSESIYHGFDAMEIGVEWCQKNISSRFSNFHFQYIPLENDLYREDGMDAGELIFPFEDSSFDFVAVISVFTHMLPHEVVNYFGEIRRVLTPGGTCFATFFIWDDDLQRIGQSSNNFTFPFDYGDYLLMDKKVKRANVAFREQYLKDQIIRHGLNLEASFLGYWRGSEMGDSKDFQDILIFRRPFH